jgi:hypothetical protein
LRDDCAKGLPNRPLTTQVKVADSSITLCF